MLRSNILMLLILHSQALVQHLQPHKRGQLPLSVSSTKFLGDVHSSTTYVNRDLGFAGQVGSYVLLSYGDTLYTDANYSTTPIPFRGIVSDSVAFATHDPLTVLDVNLNNASYPQQFFPLLSGYGEDPSTSAIGITNVVETYPGIGVMFYLLNNRPNGTNNLLGAGIGIVSLSDTYPYTPFVQRLGPGQYWWDGSCEPWYGDVGAMRHTDGFIYAYGHAKDVAWVYLTRVAWQNATDLACYEYWNGTCWQSERLYNPGEKQGVFWQVNQGQVIWSPFYECFLFIYCGMSFTFLSLLMLPARSYMLSITVHFQPALDFVAVRLLTGSVKQTRG